MIRIRTVRVVTASLVILVILLGAACRNGYGTICSFGAWGISFTCPLGFLQVALANKKLLPQLWLSVAVVLLSIVILGRFFCAWVCPVALLRGVFRGKGAVNSNTAKRERRSTTSQPCASSSSRSNAAREPLWEGTIWASYSRYVILGGTLLSSFLFGFPVFCVVCPVGVFFGSLFAVNRLLFNHQPSLELLLFPALLGLELLVLKRWCSSICPLGALLSIVSGLNLFVRPTVKKDKCLALQGAHSRVCQRVCPEAIDLLKESGGFSPKNCIKCLECYEKCPARAIKISLISLPRPVAGLRQGHRQKDTGEVGGPVAVERLTTPDEAETKREMRIG
jgi:ferredoxin-type protein NapH